MPPRTNGLSSAASALRYWERRQEVVANNLANVSTDGFKGERVFARMMGDALPVAQTATDQRSGTFRQTGNALDVAVEGDGYLVVETPDGERFRRGGSFQLDATRRLVDADGRPVLGDRGAITLPVGEVAIDGAGRVRVDGREVAQLRLERTTPGASLLHDAGSLFIPDASRQPVPLAERKVRQGFVEESNVSSVGSLVDMIAVQRAYASVQKAVTTLDEIRGTAANDLGRPI
jgi:flagellar basal-body rod protein FlgF